MDGFSTDFDSCSLLFTYLLGGVFGWRRLMGLASLASDLQDIGVACQEATSCTKFQQLQK